MNTDSSTSLLTTNDILLKAYHRHLDQAINKFANKKETKENLYHRRNSRFISYFAIGLGVFGLLYMIQSFIVGNDDKVMDSILVILVAIINYISMKYKIIPEGEKELYDDFRSYFHKQKIDISTEERAYLFSVNKKILEESYDVDDISSLDSDHLNVKNLEENLENRVDEKEISNYKKFTTLFEK